MDDPASGPWNMAVDEVLLASAVRERRLTLRLYGWSQPTVSLGYFQPHAARSQHPESLECPVVRRASGGGAIVHDREITYSLAVPAGLPLAAAPAALYRQVHLAFVRALADVGIVARLHGTQPPRPLNRSEFRSTTSQRSRIEPFLCFERRAVGDILVGREKVAGSAQRRRQGGVLQHGSLLLAASPAAPRLRGIHCLSGLRRSPAEWADLFARSLALDLALELEPEAVRSGERAGAERLAGERYASPAWTLRK
ncbi:MAG: hypothetical protein WD847_18125 [Pirellulales bacterium]